MMIGAAVSPCMPYGAGDTIWTPGAALGLVPGKIIEWIDPDTVTLGGGVITDWNTKGPANQIQLSSTGACTLTSTNGVPHIDCPAGSTADMFTNATTLNVVGLDIWTLGRINTGGSGVSGLFGGAARFSNRLYTRMDNGVIEVISAFNNQLRAVAGSVPIGSWFIGRMKSDATTASLIINGVTVDTAAHSDDTFTFDLFGGCHDSLLEPWNGGIHSFLSVLGTPDAELEANLTTHFETLRDALNGV